MDFKAILPHIPTAEEAIERLMSMYKSTESRSPSVLPGVERLRRLEARRVSATSSWLLNTLNTIAYGMPFLKDLHPFYRELISLMVDVDRYRHSLGKIANAKAAILSIRRDALRMIRSAADRDGIVRARRMYLSRMVDLINDLGPELAFLKETAIKVGRLPSINVDAPTVVVSGMPNTGKSSLVACVSSKRPEIAEYPFTTKELIIGHVRVYGEYALQVIDTPGLLDRPLSERNPIELRAILALNYLANVILFMVDPTPHSGYPLEQQVRLLKEVMGSFKAPIVGVVNKIDIASPGEVKRAEDVLNSLGLRYFEVSALQCRNTGDLMQYVIDTYLKDRLVEYLKSIHEKALAGG